MDIISLIAEEIKADNRQVEAAVKLIDEGNTIPFIARKNKGSRGADKADFAPGIRFT